jgi:hypothetical protein
MASPFLCIPREGGRPAFTCALIVETQRLDDVDQDNVARIPIQQYQLDFYGYRRLKACRSIRCVCIA